MSEQILQILSSSILITGLVIIMMMLIECINVWSKGRYVNAFKKSGPAQVIICTLLGAVPGCMGGFAVVSMHTHGLVSLGALIAMMIASSGDEAFVMLAMIPRQAVLITLGLSALAIITGLAVDSFNKSNNPVNCHTGNYSNHAEDNFPRDRHFSWKRVLIFIGVIIFLTALCLGYFEEGNQAETAEGRYMLGGINLLSEDWMNIMFAIFGVSVIFMTISASDHFVEEHLWHHVIYGHLLKIFLWTAGTLAVISVLLHYIDVSAWIGDNTILMIIIAAIIGIIPESGPHLIFVTLYASGIVPLPVLIASCISQDGHSALPLLAENRRSFVIAKSVNLFVAVAAGLFLLLFQ